MVNAIDTVARMQQVRLLSNYERNGAMDGAFSPYESAFAFGQVSSRFDLNGVATVELKRALVALAQFGADPQRAPDPITERVWQNIILDGEYADAWEGPAADELVAALSRYAPASGIAGPYTFLRASANGRYGINGGPQPTAAGLEVIAGAVQQLLGGQPRMSLYMNWRNSVIDPPSAWFGPSASDIVSPNTKVGPFWKKDGYTTANENAAPDLVALVNDTDDNLIGCWNLIGKASSEADRAKYLSECVLPARAQRDEAARMTNLSVPTPTCEPYFEWDYAKGQCVRMGGVIDVPEVTPSDEMCIDEYVKQGKTQAEAKRLCNVRSVWLSGMALPLAVGAVLGGGLWWLQSRKRKSR